MTIEIALSETTPMQFYGEGVEVLAFVRLCPNCGRFVKPGKEVRVDGLDHWIEEPNAACAKCGRVTMPYVGWWEV